MVKMIRNYQRSGGGSVDLGPIYSSINAIKNEVNSLISVTNLSTLTSIGAAITAIDKLSSSITELSTAFTSHTSLSDYKYRTYTAAVGESFNTLYTSLTSHTSYFNWMRTTYEEAVQGSFSTISTSIASLISQETASLDSLINNSLSTLSTSITSLLDWRGATMSRSITSRIDSLSSSIMDIKSSISTLSNPTSIASLISQETASLESLVTASLSTLSTSITSLLDWRLSTMSTSLTNRINEFATEIVTMNDYISTLTSIMTISTLTSLTTGRKTLTNPTMNLYVFTDPVLYSGPNVGMPMSVLKPYANTYMKGVTWSDVPSTTAPGVEIVEPANLNNCLVYGDLVCIDAYSAQFSKVTASNAVFKNNNQITLSSCNIGKIDWLDGGSGQAIVNKCTIDALCITGTGTEPANDANALRFNSNSIKYMHMLHSNGQAIMSNNTVLYGTFNVNNYENRGTAYAKHIDVTAAYVNILNDMRADKINVYCTEKLYCINNTLPYMNVSFCVTNVDTHNTFPFMVESCSISHGVFYCDVPDSASVNPGDFELNSCTFETLSMDCYYASLANISINEVADLKIGSAELKSNTCKGIMAGMFSVLSMSENSLTVGEIYYMSSTGSSNTISMAGHLR